MSKLLHFCNFFKHIINTRVPQGMPLVTRALAWCNMHIVIALN